MPAVSPKIRFFVLDGHGILFHPGTGRLWVLNSVAAAIWCLLPDMPDERAISRHVAQRFGIDRKRAEQDVRRCIATFQRDGLLAGGCPAVQAPPQPALLYPGKVRYRGPGRWAVDTVIRPPGATVRFRSEDRKLGEQFVALFRHLAASGRQAAGVDAELLLARDDGGEGWTVFLDGRRHVRGVAGNAVLPHLVFLLAVRAMRGLDSALLLHGAVLARGGATLVLAGVAGSGKTTLAALLAVSGWRFYTDELVVLDPRNGTVEPFPMAMSIKPGSVAVLAPLYPELRRLPAWIRTDGKLVRYLPPPAASLPVKPGERSMPTSLVFPGYVPGAAAGLAVLDRIDALQRLAATGSSDRVLREEDVAAMINLIGRCPAHALVYGDAREAVKLVERELYRPGRKG